MGKAEEWCRLDKSGLCGESLIWFEGLPVVVCDKRMAAGFFCTGKIMYIRFIIRHRNIPYL